MGNKGLPGPQSLFVWPGPWWLLEPGESRPCPRVPLELLQCPGDPARAPGSWSRGGGGPGCLHVLPTRTLEEVVPPRRHLGLRHLICSQPIHLPGAASGWSFQRCYVTRGRDCNYGQGSESPLPWPPGQTSPDPFAGGNLGVFISLRVRACVRLSVSVFPCAQLMFSKH